METLKKYPYMSPETVILSLETKTILQDTSPVPGPTTPNTGEPGSPGGGFGAPWRF